MSAKPLPLRSTSPPSSRTSALGTPASAGATAAAVAYINSAVWTLDSVPAAVESTAAALADARKNISARKRTQDAQLAATVRQCKDALNALDSISAEAKRLTSLVADRDKIMESIYIPLRQALSEYRTSAHQMAYLAALDEFNYLKRISNEKPTYETWTRLLDCRDKIAGLPGSICKETGKKLALFSAINAHIESKAGPLEAKYRAEFAAALDALNWPNSELSKDRKLVENAVKAYRVLSKIAIKSARSVIVQAVRLRFEFHFRGDRPTNNPEHPEWYVTYLRAPLISHEWFLAKLIGTEHQQELLETAQEIENLAHEKFDDDMDILATSPQLLLRTLVQLASLSCDVQTQYSSADNDGSQSEHVNDCFLLDNASAQITGLKLPVKTQDTVIKLLKDFINESMVTFTHQKTSWTAFYDDEGDFDDNEEIFDLEVANSTEESSIHGRGPRPLGMEALASTWRPSAQDASKKSVFQIKIEKYLELFVDLSRKLDPAFAAAFFNNVAFPAIAECIAAVRGTALHNILEIDALARMGSAAVSLSGTMHDWRLQVMPRLITVETEKSFETTLNASRLAARDIVEKISHRVCESTTVLLNLGESPQSRVSDMLYQIKRACDSQTFSRIYMRIIVRADNILPQLLSQPLTAAYVIQTHRALVSLFGQFAPPSINAKFPRSDSVADLANMRPAERERFLGTVMAIASEDRNSESSASSNWCLALSPAEAIKVLRNVLS